MLMKLKLVKLNMIKHQKTSKSRKKHIENQFFTYAKSMPNSKKTINICFSRREESYERSKF